MSKLIFVLTLVLFAMTLVNRGKAILCRRNEIWTAKPACRNSCLIKFRCVETPVKGCYCKDGYVLEGDGKNHALCIRQEDCNVRRKKPRYPDVPTYFY